MCLSLHLGLKDRDIDEQAGQQPLEQPDRIGDLFFGTIGLGGGNQRGGGQPRF